jgi:hypothetical protein
MLGCVTSGPRRSLRAMRRLTVAVALAAATLASVGATDALAAKSVGVEGHVLAPPSRAGKKLSLPVLLSRTAERRAKVGTPVVRLVVRRGVRVSAPAASGTGRVAIAASTVRAGDRVRAGVRISRQIRRKARRQRVPMLGSRTLWVTARASALSDEELTRLVFALQQQLAALSRRVDELSQRQASDSAALRAHIEVLLVRLSTLNTGLGALQSGLAALEADIDARLDSLEGDVDGALARSRLTWPLWRPRSGHFRPL